MSAITTHVLDTSRGEPAVEVAVILEMLREGEWSLIAQAKTDQDGRARLTDKAELGRYRITFYVEPEAFYPEISIQFRVRDARHHHIPLLLSPFGYSTYRGS
jgi:5-hydroxyisourate hydrolase